MNFFKSVFSDDPQPEDPTHEVSEEQEQQHSPDHPSSAAAQWGFGGLIKTLATRSESVIQTYSRDLAEFGSGLRNETTAIRDAAARAVRDLPVSLEAGASAAQGSLQSVGRAIDGSIQALLSTSTSTSTSTDPDPIGNSSKRYGRFEAQLLAIQADPATFAAKPEDMEDFTEWMAGFDLADKEEEIERLLYENDALEGLLETMVPDVVDHEAFWARYYYRVHKLRQAEDARANLVKRAISRDEEELSWEVDDEEEGEEQSKLNDEEKNGEGKEEEYVDEIQGERTLESLDEKKSTDTPHVEKFEEHEAMPMTEEEALEKLDSVGSRVDESTSKTDDQAASEVKSEPVESSKDSDISVVSSQPSMPEDLEWDEIEDLGEHDHEKVKSTNVGSSRVDLNKKLSRAEEDEDLSWDIEDDDS